MKTNVNNFKATIEEKKAMLDMLQYVIEDIEYRENAILDHYKENGEEQRKDKMEIFYTLMKMERRQPKSQTDHTCAQFTRL